MNQVPKEGLSLKIPIIDGKTRITQEEGAQLLFLGEVKMYAKAMADGAGLNQATFILSLKKKYQIPDDHDLEIDFNTGILTSKKREEPKEEPGGKTESPSPKKSA